MGGLTPDVLAANCTHIAGQYWTIWPSVFHANMVLHERGERRTVWGMGFRCDPTYRRYRSMCCDRLRVASPLSDPDLGLLQMTNMLPMFRRCRADVRYRSCRVLERRRTILVAVPVAEPLPE